MTADTKTSHPHFNDRGTLDWHTSWTAALADAAARNRLVFIEMGRELCSNCRTLVEGVIPQPKIAALLRDHFVGLASDCDAPEDPVTDLGMEHLADATMLPFVMIVDGQGEYLGGGHGAVHPDRLLEQLEDLVAEHGA